MASVTPRPEPEIGDWLLWQQPHGNLLAEVLRYDEPTGTFLLCANGTGMVGWVRRGDFEWMP